MSQIGEELRMTWIFVKQKKHLVALVPLAGFFIGKYLTQLETERLTLFRDKSALFGNDATKPSWP